MRKYAWYLVTALVTASTAGAVVMHPTAPVTNDTAAERVNWEAELGPLNGTCKPFPAAFYAERGEVVVTKVTGKSAIRPGDTQAINAADFRLDQFSPERKEFGCDMIMTFHANQIAGPVEHDGAVLERVIIGKLTRVTLKLGGTTELTARIVGAAEPGTEITRAGRLHALPLGFATPEEFRTFAAILKTTLAEVLHKLPPGLPTWAPAAFVVGSSAKGRSAGDPAKGKPAGVPFDGKNEPSDVDFNIINPELFREGERLHCNTHLVGKGPVRRLSENCEELEGRQRGNAGAGSGYPELAAMRARLAALLKANVPKRFGGADRPVNYVVMDGHPAGIAEIEIPIH